MKPLVIAATTLALASPVFAQTATPMPNAEQAAENAAATAETAAENAAEAAETAADEAGAAATQAADDAAAAADTAADAAATAADNAANAAAGMGEAAAENAADAADAAADAASDAADAANDAAAAAPVTPPDVNPPAISEAEPGMLSSWLTGRHIWTTNQPSSTAWVDPAVTERPADWQDIAKVNDIVLDDSGQLVGYVADIGGFLGIGAKKVLLGADAIHLITVGNDTFFATNYTKEELQALPDFDEKTVRK
ncbi:MULTISPECIES: PRC-barrel domain-containing protein [unclassified Paracoccus (in: a-proteobacteria)]|uniref:PRC-barrel domain-containing protein n=1 Tax=unclassified Paracoccus (in: a-proteobacteria) TaxID=2688777 RepID=UPI0012B332A4|nr:MULTISPECIES: PRC-barrel domain-containing protein [unclassified Paracoccus (in: a-proteobacteria)]UXU73980.1 PRC-barrel domain-containing protein [Paracoccus sp. SMMA_5]UXU79868.1 PRC-barrel domain-containing protein [Paracoccus sp. SMMA_5_TC]